MINLTFLNQNFRKAIFDSIPAGVSPECLDFDVKNKIAILRQEKGITILGCELCLTNKIEQDYREDLFISGQKLKNGREKPELLSLPNEVLNNFWMCPCCEKPFVERMIKI